MQFKHYLMSTITFFISLNVYSGGMPVIDTNALAQELNETIYSITVIGDLFNEISSTSNDLVALNTLREEMIKLNEDIRTYQEVNQNLNEITDPQFYRAQAISDYVSQISNYVRKLKKFLVLAKFTKQRPQSISNMLSLFRDEHQEQKDRFETTMKTFDEKERIAKLRMELRSKINAKKSLEKEFNIISKRTGGRITNFRTSTKQNELKNLW